MKPPVFQEAITCSLLQRERLYLELLQRIKTKKRRRVVLCDRGVLDVLAFISPKKLANILSDFGLNVSSSGSRYRGVIHLVTAASDAEEYYTLDNNDTRKETPEEAREQDRKLQEAWLSHPHQIIVGNEGVNFVVKVQKVLAALARIFEIPEPLETGQEKYSNQVT